MKNFTKSQHDIRTDNFANAQSPITIEHFTNIQFHITIRKNSQTRGAISLMRHAISWFKFHKRTAPYHDKLFFQSAIWLKKHAEQFKNKQYHNRTQQSHNVKNQKHKQQSYNWKFYKGADQCRPTSSKLTIQISTSTLRNLTFQMSSRTMLRNLTIKTIQKGAQAIPHFNSQ